MSNSTDPSDSPELNVYLNGRIVPESRAAISVSDAGFLHGASVFSTALARGGVIFRLDRHLARMFDTAHMIGLRVGATPDGLAAAAARRSRYPQRRGREVRSQPFRDRHAASARRNEQRAR